MRKRYLIIFGIFILMFKLAYPYQTAGTKYSSNLLILSSGGGSTSSTKFNSMFAISQDAVGSTSSAKFLTKLGFYQSGIIATEILNTLPNITIPSLNPVISNTSSDIQCIATARDSQNQTLIVEWWWYNSSTLKLWGNKTGVSNGTSTVITTLGSGNTTRGELWNCTVRASDGSLSSASRSSVINISNAPPTHSTPTITPSSPTTLSNLTCNYNNVNDIDSDRVVNITNWYRFNRSVTLFNMPFEGGSNSTRVRDYGPYYRTGKPYDDNITNYDGNTSARWNRTEGRVGGAFRFDGIDDYIYLAEHNLFDFANKSITLSAWIKGTRGTIMNHQTGGTPGSSWYWAYNQFNHRAVSNTISMSWSGTGDNQWHHVVVTMNGSFAAVYRDGVMVTNDTYSSLINNNNNPRIGAYGSSSTYPTMMFNGTIDEIMIINRSLTSHQVYQMYLAGSQSRSFNQLVDDETSTNDAWHCSVTPNDGYVDGTTKNSSIVTLQNSLPPAPTLIAPTNSNTTVHDLTPQFLWQASTDPDGDPLNYTINITQSICPGIYQTNNTPTSFTPSYELCRDKVYLWQVRAYDGTGYGPWSQTWNFTIQSYLSIIFTNDLVNFGIMYNNQSNSTDDPGLSALIVENTGNIVANISRISANASIWQSVGLNTVHFQFKADNDTTEANSFNWTASTTAWENLTAANILNKTVISYLQYNASNDEAEIDLKLKVPINEPVSVRSALIYLIGENS
jgi:hypothetical protein